MAVRWLSWTVAAQQACSAMERARWQAMLRLLCTAGSKSAVGRP